MRFYADHCAVAPTLTGQLIPEPIYDESTYRNEVLQPIGKEVRPLDVDGVLELDFLNARGAIARFDRGSVELRVMDVQEYPGADVAICAAVTAVIKALVEQQSSSYAKQQTLPAGRLRTVIDDVSEKAENALVEDAEYLSALGIESSSISAGDVWRELLGRVVRDDAELASLFAPLEIIQKHGTLATRIQKALGAKFDHEELLNVYDQLADCLDLWEPFQP